MDIDINRIYDRMPEEMQSSAQRWFYVLHPRRSWAQRIRPETAHDAFVDRFFDDEAEFERYQREFFESSLPEHITGEIDAIDDEYDVYDAHRDECLKYYALVRKFQPGTIVETGVYSGVSTTTILAALAENGHGHLRSIDCSAGLRAGETDPEHRARQRQFSRDRPSCAEPTSHILPPGKEPGWLIPDHLRDRWTLTQGSSRTELPAVVADTASIDLFFHDSAHTLSRMLFEFECVWDVLEPGGLIVSNHADWNDAVDTFAEEHRCEHGDLSFHYLGYRETEEPIPCRTAYIRKPGGESA
ncbi:class I SAM-dependent methyltransferase [Halomicroarcula sp. GCM10025709]|uniref:class I SAM-dependent methyltransferase n=1 Tax=Haloarcula TaxID=2237 RepID=UPI0024C45112|nr:class I SAM-dependent methyltransferase [Halomicroarcula sp. YJ-61-S]